MRTNYAWIMTLALAVLGTPRTSVAAEPVPPKPTPDASAQAIHASAIVLDSHVDIPGPHYATKKLDPGQEQRTLQCDLVKMAAGGVDGVFLAAYVGQGPRDDEGYRQAYADVAAQIAAIRRLAEQLHPDRCALAASPVDVERIVRDGKRAIVIGVENGYAIGTDVENVRRLYAMGARYLTLCHNGHNQLCDSCTPLPRLGDKDSEHGGLSGLGRQVVAEMNRLGMMVDVSHLADASVRDVLAASRTPVIASHCGCRAVYSHRRNLSDEQLRAIAARGGVVQIVTVASFLRSPRSVEKDASAGGPRATFATFSIIWTMP